MMIGGLLSETTSDTVDYVKHFSPTHLFLALKVRIHHPVSTSQTLNKEIF